MTEYYPPQPYPAPSFRQRPTGVTLLAILNILVGVLLLLGALGLFLAMSLAGDPVFQEALADSDVPEWFMDQLSLLLGVLGAFSLIMGVLSLVVSYGFLNGKGWSWYLAVIYGFLSVGLTVVSTILTGGLIDFLTLGISIVIPVLIIVYLFQPHVKAWFSV
ncbi:hypothetical protein AOA80_10925 [Methanomassiliicoccales archaeon RumEn M1]|nr:hypothetical protein AOA80_10925 [Methanomassiliicoccales archaeon RumEn M1]